MAKGKFGSSLTGAFVQATSRPFASKSSGMDLGKALRWRRSIRSRSSCALTGLGVPERARGYRKAVLCRQIGRGAVVLALLASGSASASPDVPAAMAGVTLAAPAPVVPPSFQLQGTNGYAILVVALQSRESVPGSVRISVGKGDMAVVYSAPATVTETSIDADLGTLGRISVNFHPSGQLIRQHPKCLKRAVTVLGGNYEGTIAFHGEEDYTEVETTSMPGDIKPLLAMLCGSIVTSGGGSPNRRGAELYVRNPGLGPRFSVVKASPSSPARFFVAVSEYIGGISIERYAGLSVPPSGFRYDRNLQTATLRPPAPFSGTAHFDRRKKANRRWSGDLTIDMPGLADAPLTGRLLRAGLVYPE